MKPYAKARMKKLLSYGWAVAASFSALTNCLAQSLQGPAPSIKLIDVVQFGYSADAQFVACVDLQDCERPQRKILNLEPVQSVKPAAPEPQAESALREAPIALASRDLSHATVAPSAASVFPKKIVSTKRFIKRKLRRTCPCTGKP